jgi:transcriptional antiterminator RfaH
MAHRSALEWYLVNTKPQKERFVADQLRAIADDVFLPLLKAKAPRWGRMAESVGPLFPCYVFSRFDLQAKYFDIKYLQGVKGLVSAGNEAIIVPSAIVEEIRGRMVDGVVEIGPKSIAHGERVMVVEGPFKGLEAVFERYLSGAARVAILLSTIGANGVRMVLPAASVSKSV